MAHGIEEALKGGAEEEVGLVITPNLNLTEEVAITIIINPNPTLTLTFEDEAMKGALVRADGFEQSRPLAPPRGPCTHTPKG